MFTAFTAQLQKLVMPSRDFTCFGVLHLITKCFVFRFTSSTFPAILLISLATWIGLHWVMFLSMPVIVTYGMFFGRDGRTGVWNESLS